MRQHSAQDTDEDDKHGRIQPTSHEYRLEDIVGEPHDQEIDRQRKSQGKVLGSPDPYDDGHKDDSRPDLQDGKNQHKESQYARMRYAASFNPMPASSD